MSSLVGAVDGGQSSTRAAIADDTGHIVGTGTGPAADLVGEPRDSDRQRAAIAAALAEARRAAGLMPDTPLAAVVVGLTGHDGPASTPAFAPFAAVVSVVHDAVIAHAGALADTPGIVVLAGTGSVAVGNAVAGEPLIRAGGWGPFFGDEGGALAIARDAIASAMRAADHGGPSPLGEAALHFFGVPELRDLQHAVAHGEVTRAALAAFATEVLVLAAQVNPSPPALEARAVRKRAAGALAELARIVDRHLAGVPSRRISYAGGVFGAETMRRVFCDALHDSVPSAVVVEPAAEPLAGAVLLALRLTRGASRTDGLAVG